MEIWRKCGEEWPEGIVLYVECMGFTEEEVVSFKDVIGHIGVWLRKRNIYDSDTENESSDEESCECHKATRDLLLPCGNYLE